MLDSQCVITYGDDCKDMKSRANTYIANENAVYATAPTRMLLRVCGEEAKFGAHKENH